MNPILQQIIIETVSGEKRVDAETENGYSRAKKVYKLKVSVRQLMKNMIFICIGVQSATFGLKSFLLPNSFIDGGVTGISLLASEVSHLSISLFIILLNLPFVLLGFKQIGKAFAIKSIVAICGLAIALATMHYPVITSDKLLVSVFGGFFVGAGIGFAVRGGAVLDGTEILAIYLGKKTGMTIGDIILVFNIFIFSLAAYLLGIEPALYSILAYMTAAKTVDFVIEGIEEYTGVTVISVYSEEIRLMIIEKLGRGVTVYNGKRGFGKRGESRDNVDIIYTVITRLEIGRLQNEVEKIDKHAFVVMSSVKDTRGGMVKKRPLSH